MPNGKPNILILWGDDIGWYNISHNNRGAMGYETPNIDRVARWVLDHIPAIYAAQGLTAEQIQSFAEFPPRQKPASFNLDSLMEKMQQATDGSMH